ncbi:hypothetical protein BE221DRAFT_69121 [Ostreococcus tauri]|uniref:Uncharacterized protein n=1 Tax=Ostreococcus tauri TaxID=70448 RepID=A0A1Y5IN66_OSTTA|nr:hypothetical protein BE221DRAFT_69121 [Ostreococcus tauri]
MIDLYPALLRAQADEREGLQGHVQRGDYRGGGQVQEDVVPIAHASKHSQGVQAAPLWHLEDEGCAVVHCQARARNCGRGQHAGLSRVEAQGPRGEHLPVIQVGVNCDSEQLF